jgi:hypothetical protein
MFRLTGLAAALAMTLAVAAPARAADFNPAFTPTGGWEWDGDGPWTLGYSFRADKDLIVSALGAYDFGQDGFTTDHQVGLWDASGILLASVVVRSSDQLVDRFRYSEIDGVRLVAGATYMLGASDYGFGDGYLLDADVGSMNGITYLNSNYLEGFGLLRPTKVGFAGGYFGANMLTGAVNAVSAVPEPSSWALMLVGFGLIGGTMRASRRRAGGLPATA